MKVVRNRKIYLFRGPESNIRHLLRIKVNQNRETLFRGTPSFKNRMFLLPFPNSNDHLLCLKRGSGMSSKNKNRPIFDQYTPTSRHLKC